MLSAKDSVRRLKAAHTLLVEPTTTREKFASVCTLIRGVDSRIDQMIQKCEEGLSAWDKLSGGEIIHLTAEHLPENTEEEKKRKKYILLFITSWKQLQSEVARVQEELQNTGGEQPVHTASRWGRIIKGARGPLGIITIVAIGVVALQQTSVEVTIRNEGCPTVYPSTSIPVSLPGLSLPSEALVSGGSVEAKLPGVPVYVDGTSRSALTIKVLTVTLTFGLPSNVRDVTLNGATLLGKETNVSLSGKEKHELVLYCS